MRVGRCVPEIKQKKNNLKRQLDSYFFAVATQSKYVGNDHWLKWISGSKEDERAESLDQGWMEGTFFR